MDARRSASQLGASIFGRDDDLRRLQRILQDGQRLITITGPGGIGKTTLATHLAWKLHGLGDHVQFVDLSSQSDSARVLPLISAALPGESTTLKPFRRIVEFAQDTRTVLVLDNFEQLLPAAADLVRLLSCTSSLRLVVTSRAPLNVHDEHEYALTPLALPDGDRIRDSPAVQLFVQRAQATCSNFTLSHQNDREVAQLCRVLEGMPLAIELAAQRLRTFALPDLLTRLDHPLRILKADFRDRPERLRSLRSAVQWSYDLLPNDDREVFECCAVFADSFTPEALVAVWGDDGVLDHVQHLIEHSFLRRVDSPETRWVMLQPLRELALEKLDVHPLGEHWRERHARYCQARLEEMRDCFLTSAQDERGVYLPDYPNMRAALQWAVDRERADLAYAIVHPLRLLWRPQGLDVTESPLVERLLALPAPNPQLRVLALDVSTRGLWLTDRLAELEVRLHELLSLCTETGDVAGAAWAKLDVASLHHARGRSEEAWQVFQQIMHDHQLRGGDAAADKRQRLLYASALLMASRVLLDLGRLEQSLEFATRALERYRAAGNVPFELSARTGVGFALLSLGRVADAGALLLESLREAARQRLWLPVHEALVGLSWAAAEVQEWERCVKFAVYEAQLHDQRPNDHLRRQQREHLLRARRQLGELGYQEAQCEAERWGVDAAIQEAEALIQLMRDGEQTGSERAQLSARELEVLKLVTKGHPDRKIAQLLGISPRTASNHVSHLLRKLGLRNRVELARWGLTHEPLE